MSEIVGFDLTPDAGTTLRKVLKLNLYPFLAKFEEISVGATKVTTLVKLSMLVRKACYCVVSCEKLCKKLQLQLMKHCFS